MVVNLLAISSPMLNERPIAKEPKQRSRILAFSAQKFACTLENPQLEIRYARLTGTTIVYKSTFTAAFSEKRCAACEMV